MLTRINGSPLLEIDKIFAPLAGEAAIGVAVSGGADSLALMLLAAAWRERHGTIVHVYSVDHRLRAASASECEMVAREAEKLGLVPHILGWDAAKAQSGLQEAARLARYRLIGARMREQGVTTLLTAHHLDDQAETVLMRMAHGSGLDGLGAMRVFAEVEGVRLFRPLLGLRKAELEALVLAAGLAPVVDPSNDMDAFERVRWRKLMPCLAEQGLDAQRIAKFAERAERAKTALDAYTKDAVSRVVQIGQTGLVRVDRGVWQELPEEIALRVLIWSVRWAGAGLRPHGLQQIEALAETWRNSSTASTQTIAGAVVAGDAAGLSIWREAGRIDPAPRRIDAGDQLIWDSRFRVGNRADRHIFVQPAWEMSRENAERITGRKLTEPMAVVRAAPVVKDSSGAVLAVGGLCLDAAVSVDHANWTNETRIFSVL